jgi:hypothetical protein
MRSAWFEVSTVTLRSRPIESSSNVVALPPE